jgi:hypothetical protein
VWRIAVDCRRRPLTPVRFQQVLAAAKAYGADRTLIFYSSKPKAVGSEARQNAELVEAVMTNVRYPTPGASDAAMDAECKAKNVKQSYFTFSGPLIAPLDMRPPFDSLK